MIAEDRPPTVFRTADLYPKTVTRYSAGELRSLAARRRRGSGTWNSPVARRSVPRQLLVSAMDAAEGDPNRLWFDADGAVYVLNHTRAETCVSPACPPCAEKRPRARA